ncbi:carbohydrate binding protein [Streptomyces sp. BK022]|uniref:carbohydrate binding domain-containing protein n=1 Tax=Streptomyces sp. BK022 TaxID=2512123 RepID=UPI0010298FAE|nr:carbohydrate binding domain-containing protein [Streptomyces sp. BK022]RZU35945.1 carbohydrate binding protein [Streptomyces sp. BK022]
MTTYDITFSADDDWTPGIPVSGAIVVRSYRVSSPELDGTLAIGGSIGIKIPRPQPLAPEAGQFTVGGHLAVAIKVPAAAFKDFSHYPYQGVDPAMAWFGINSGSLKSAVAGSYSRPYAAFTGPVDYPVSGSGYAWKRAAYASVGFKFASMSANKHQILDAVQFEPLPLGSTGPSNYQNAREIQVIIKPTRLNYATNPNMESGISGYGSTGQATLAADAYHWQGTQSLKVTVPSTATADSGISVQATGLIPGRTYTMSAKVAIAQGCGDIAPWSGTGSTQLGAAKWTQAASRVDPKNKRWRTLYVTFTASSSSLNVGMNVLKSTMAAGLSSIFWVDGVLIEEGASVRDYFDGSMGEDYLWEQGGSPNLARSYYYENYIERSYLIQTLLEENVPLGITANAPQYAVLPTQ